MKRAEVADVALTLRDVWMPSHGVPALILFGNGSKFTSSVTQHLCEGVGAGKIYSTPYHPQGNSVVESYMQSLKKRLAALVSEEGREWDLFLFSVAFGYNSMLHIGAGFLPFFLVRGREAVLLAQRVLDEPQPDLKSKKWLCQMWKARIFLYEKHSEQRKICKQWLEILKP